MGRGPGLGEGKGGTAWTLTLTGTVGLLAHTGAELKGELEAGYMRTRPIQEGYIYARNQHTAPVT
jgi:hypothetical protein